MLFADSPKWSWDLSAVNNPSLQNNLVTVIVQFKKQPSQLELAIFGTFGGNSQIKKQFSHINAVHVTVPVWAIPILNKDPNVKYISPDRANKKLLDITTAAMGANAAWSLGLDGTGIGVAVIDSGIYNHDDLKTANGTGSRIVYSESFVPGLSPSDQFGHGTHVAGIIGSNGADSSGPTFSRTYKGVAPNVNLINLRVLDANGAGTDSQVIAAIDRAIQLKSTYNIRVINISLGRPVYESYTFDPLCQEVEQAWKAGIVVVTAAGNYGRNNGRNTGGYGTIVAPGNDPYVITVGAMNSNGTVTRTDDKITSYSSKGPTSYDHLIKPDLVAPGNKITSLMAPGSTLATAYPELTVDTSTYSPGVSGKSGAYFVLSGTSMATPVVSGAAALLLQRNPSLTPDQVKARLMKTAQKALTTYTTSWDQFTLAAFNNQSDLFTIGAGYLDIQAALANNDLVPHAALSPTAKFVSSHTVTLVSTTSVTWGDTVVWGDSMVWGDSLVFGSFAFKGTVNGQSVIWGDTVVWGDATVAGDSVIWGDSVLTASSTIVGLDDGDDDQ